MVAITGATSGVGRATAIEFARAGGDGISIGLLARGQDALDATAAQVRSFGATAVVLPTDVADADAVERAAAELQATRGPIDVWVNNAMVSVFAPVWEITADEYLRVTQVTYLGVVNGTLSALRRMRARDRGVIVQVGSALAYRGIPLQSAYCASKHAIQGFTESLRCELINDGSGVRVTMVQMPALNTPQFEMVRSRLPKHPRPVAPIFEPQLAAAAVRAAAQNPARREWWVGGSTAIAIMGNAVAPGLGDRYLARTGVESQQIQDVDADPNRADNLYEPLGGDHGECGRFSDRSTSRSLQWVLTRHRVRFLGVTLAGTLAGLAVASWKHSEQGR